jgi:hypothetical protein
MHTLNCFDHIPWWTQNIRLVEDKGFVSGNRLFQSFGIVLSELTWVNELLALWVLEVAGFITVSFNVVEVSKNIM